MDNLFSFDNKFFEALGKISDIVILNFLFIISCIPIITIGASVTATYSVAMKMTKDEETYITKEFIRQFKENFKTSTIIWMIILVIGTVLVFDFYMSRLVLDEVMSKVLQFIFTMVSIVFVFTLTYVFPIIAKFENTIILMIVINLSELLLILLFSNYWGHILFLYTALGYGLIIYTNSIFFNRVFDKYIK